MSSPIKLIVGGRAKLVKHAVNQSIVMSDEVFCNPRIVIRVRELVRSYIMLARQNIIEEVSPWATIKIMVPEMLMGVCRRAAAVTSPMWLTDE